MVLLLGCVGSCEDVAHRLLASGKGTEPIRPFEHAWIGKGPSHSSLDGAVVRWCLGEVGVDVAESTFGVEFDVGPIDWAVVIERVVGVF